MHHFTISERVYFFFNGAQMNVPRFLKMLFTDMITLFPGWSGLHHQGTTPGSGAWFPGDSAPHSWTGLLAPLSSSRLPHQVPRWKGQFPSAAGTEPPR